MTNLEVLALIVILLVVIGGGVILYLALAGFPDEWTRYGASGKEMSDNARYMALGNSIAVPCAERVFIGIKKAESEE